MQVLREGTLSLSDAVCDEEHAQLQRGRMPRRPPGSSFHSRTRMAVDSMNQTILWTFTALLRPPPVITE